MFVALPGLTLAIDEVEYYEKAMQTAAKAINEFIDGRPLSVKISEFEKPDILLWAVWCIQQYARLVSDAEACNKYGDLVGKMVNYIKAGGHPNLELHDNGLLSTDGRTTPATWMNSEVNGYPCVPRSGYVVEINALWYNALMFYADILSAQGREAEAGEVKALAEKVGVSFKDTFLNQHGYLLDYVDNGYISWSVRPNMLIASSLEYSPLTIAEKKKIFDICTKELLTQKGIRSLSPKSGGYNPMYEGGQQQRDSAYHQGTVWPWLSGFYLETCLKIYKHSGLSFVDRHFVGLEEEMFYHCIGTLPELFDGNPPFHGRGALSFAMNVAAVLRVNKLLAKFYNY
jgi:predicted glycogen debranching enzyme